MSNESKKIKLPLKLGIKIVKILEEQYNIEPSRNSTGMLDFSFTEEELGLITSLKLINPGIGDLEGLKLLPKLQSLSIESHGITAHIKDRDISSIDEKDVAEISKCTNLKELSIINQAKLGYIDVSKLQNLEKLVVSHNQRLDEIYGIENLEKLWKFHCYGNNRLNNIQGLDKVICQNKNLSNIKLDVLLFPNAIGFNTNTGKYSKETLGKIRDASEIGKVFWSESLNGNKSININTNQMIQLHNKSCEILEENIPYTAETRDIIIGVEQYLSENVRYDYEGMENGHTNGYFLNEKDKKNNVRITSGPEFGTNGAYNALIKNTCVCEGYTRAMQYLLKLKGINSHNVDCYGCKDTTHMADNKNEDEYTTYMLPDNAEYHSIICIDDYHSLYDDPCWNACYYQQGDKSMPWLLKTKEEISQDHTLSFDERGIDNAHRSQPSTLIQESIKRNDLFRQAKTRASSLSQTRSSIKQHIKGQIIEKEGQEI